VVVRQIDASISQFVLAGNRRIDLDLEKKEAAREVSSQAAFHMWVNKFCSFSLPSIFEFFSAPTSLSSSSFIF